MKKLSNNISFISKVKNFFFPFYKSKEIKKLFKVIEKGKEKKTQVAMFVGGCVRKFLNNEAIDDIDIATIFSPEELKEKFKNTEFKTIDTGLEHGSITITINSNKFEITTLRKDIETDGRHAAVEYTDDWQQDSGRRDFTINSIYMDSKGKLFDPQNGINDLKKKNIKFIGESSKRIEEDYLRIIRFIRFSIHYNSTVSDSDIIKAVKINLNGVKHLSKERILNELYKIFSLKNLNVLLDNKDIKNIFILIFPEFKYLERLDKLINLINNNIIQQIPDFLFPALLVDDKDNHEYFCHKYKVSNKLKKELNLISNNYIDYKKNKNLLKKDLKKNIYRFGKNNIKNLIYFIFCAEKNFTKNLLEKNIKQIDKIELPKFPFKGQYLINQGITDGKKIGYALKELEKEWIQKDFELSTAEAKSIIEKIKN
jgi:poly(A) polymerase